MKKIPRVNVPWWQTNSGRLAAAGGMVTLATASGFLQFIPHTVGKDMYVKQVHLFKECEKVSVSDRIKKRFDDCINILKIDEISKRFYKPFTVCGFELYSIGCSKSKYGVSVGIPTNYDFETEDDIDKSKIIVNLKPVDWGSEAGQELAKSLIMPEAVQKFGICREIIQSDNHRVHFNMIYSMLPYGLVYASATAVNRRLDMFQKHVLVRLMSYSLLAAWGLGMYFLAKDTTTAYYEREADRRLCELGPEFVRSGVEFYDNILKRNMALRQLMGEDGEKQFSRHGNINFLFRRKATPITERKQFFEGKLKEISSGAASDERS